MDKYTSLYGRPADAPLGPFTPKTPQALRPGDTCTRIGTWNSTLANTDRLFIAGGFVAGEKILQIVATRDADPDAANTFTADMYLLSAPSVKFLTASTGFQAAVPVVIDGSTLPFACSATKGDSLVLVPVVGAMATAVNHSFRVVSGLPA